MNYQDIEHLIGKGEYEVALASANELLKKSSQDVEAQYLQACALMMLDRNQEALKSVNQLLQTTPNLMKGLRLAASICIKNNLGTEAVRHMETALAASNGNVPADFMITLGDSYAQAQNFSRAVETYQAALKQGLCGRYSGMAKINAGLALMNLGRFSEANTFLSDGVKEMPEHPASSLLPESLYLGLFDRAFSNQAPVTVELLLELKDAAKAAWDANPGSADAQAIFNWLKELNPTSDSYQPSEMEKLLISACADVAKSRRTYNPEERKELLKNAQAKSKSAAGVRGAGALNVRLSFSLGR